MQNTDLFLALFKVRFRCFSIIESIVSNFKKLKFCFMFEIQESDQVILGSFTIFILLQLF